MSSLVFMSFGANAGNPLAQILTGLDTLEANSGVSSLVSSSIYQTPPMGPEQPDYLNGAATFYCEHSPLDLLDLFQSIEKDHGRNRAQEVRWGPRPLDFDILLFDTLEYQCDRLTLPHPGLLERPFVILPLAEISPDLCLPNGYTAQQASLKLDTSNIQCLYTAKGLLYDSDNSNPQ